MKGARPVGAWTDEAALFDVDESLYLGDTKPVVCADLRGLTLVQQVVAASAVTGLSIAAVSEMLDLHVVRGEN